MRGRRRCSRLRSRLRTASLSGVAWRPAPPSPLAARGVPAGRAAASAASCRSSDRDLCSCPRSSWCRSSIARRPSGRAAARRLARRAGARRAGRPAVRPERRPAPVRCTVDSLRQTADASQALSRGAGRAAPLAALTLYSATVSASIASVTEPSSAATGAPATRDVGDDMAGDRELGVLDPADEPADDRLRAGPGCAAAAHAARRRRSATASRPNGCR